MSDARRTLALLDLSGTSVICLGQATLGTVGLDDYLETEWILVQKHVLGKISMSDMKCV